MTISIPTIAFFKAAGVFRVKSEEKARERFDEAFADFLDTTDDGEFSSESKDDLFAALLEARDNEKAAKIAADIARAEKRAAKEAAEKAKPVSGGMNGSRDHVTALPGGRYILTSAQNNTDVDADALASLHVFAKKHDASMLIGRMTYNKNGFQQDVDATDGIYYDNAVRPYLVNGTLDLGGVFYFLADANVIPTAKWPTSGFGAESPSDVGLIVPATRVEMRTMPKLKNDARVKTISATGTITKRNYILRKTGNQASTAHCIAAIYVDTNTNEIRVLQQMEGERGFYDVDGFYSPDGFRKLEAGDVAAFQPGDIHAEKTSDEALQATIALAKSFKPENVFLHDLLDFSSRNHHNIKDPFFLHAQYLAGGTVESDLITASDAATMFAKACKTATVQVIVSNHDQAADTWLRNTDWRYDPINAEVYLELALAKVKATKRGDETHNTLEYAFRNVAKSKATNIVFRALDQSVMIAGVEMGSHGHNGANGSKGSPKQFAALGVPMNTGHTHSPSIYGSCYTAGALEMEMGYNVGASSWAVAHTITYQNGQRQILFA